MKERPILFSGDMVRAILDGRKTQTRRAVKRDLANSFDPPRGDSDIKAGYPWFEDQNGEWHKAVDCCPYGKPGDRLWVRETWAEFAGIEPQVKIVYRADKLFDTEAKEHLCGNKWRPSIYLPRWASRITLEITGVRVERLHDISEEDARAEGCTHTGIGRHIAADEIETAREQFERLWQSINGEDSWNANPLVWVIEFRRVK